jgi:mono/diheme cytochrome c family protein
VYLTACSFCHGEDGTGGHGGGPTLVEMTSPSDVERMVALGRNNMPGFGGSLSEAEIRDVAAYVLDRIAGN